MNFARAAAELTTILVAIIEKSQSAAAPSVLDEITDDDIDNLFND